MKKNAFFLFGLLFITFAIFAEAQASKNDANLVVYYFHRTARCSSCLLIEQLTREAVTFGFEEQIKNGNIELKIINIEKSGNEYFEEQYKLTNQSVVLSMVANGTEKKWKNLKNIWDNLHERNQLIDYIQTEIYGFIKG